MLKIDDLELIGQGSQKYIYQYPDHDNRVIKVMIPKHADSNGVRVEHNTLRANCHQGIYRQFRREVLQYLQLCKNSFGHTDFMFPVKTVHGFEPTDKKLGLVTEKIISPNDKP